MDSSTLPRLFLLVPTLRVGTQTDALRPSAQSADSPRPRRAWVRDSKWMRDAKINDIYEGTGQINTLIVAREILGYGRLELK